MKLFIRRHGQKEYPYQSHSFPFIGKEIKPGDILCISRSDYHIDRVEYGKSDLIVYATKIQYLQKGIKQYGT